MELWESILLKDNKEFVGYIINLDGKQVDSLELLMKYFVSDFVNNGPEALEKRDFAQYIYNNLGWNKGSNENPNKYYDVINSFWATFAYALVAYAEREDALTFKKIHDEMENQNTLKKTIEKWECKLFGYGDKTYLQIAMNGKLGDINKKSYAKKFIDDENLQSLIIKKYFINDSRYVGKKIVKLAALCHCSANFMPCPDVYEQGELSYNSIKGDLKDVKDYFPLMIDKIQQCIDSSENLKYDSGEISLKTVKKWGEWFIDNRKKYILEEYYYLNGKEDGEVRIVGIPLFAKQSLSYPIPRTEEEVTECLDNILSKIQSRALKMANKLKDKNL